MTLPDPPVMSQQTTQLEQWRAIANEFHCVQGCLARGTLRPDFRPADLARLRKSPASTAAIRGIFTFLLHIYNSDHRFDLAETARWDEQHLAAFTRWVTGQSSGTPCRYF